jgi:glutathione synthase/RimK-type ligase-like ATP-grasp enzyme
MQKRVALITWSGLPEGAASERLLLPHLAAANVEVQFIDWRSASCDFSRFDLLVLRSCWDSHLHGAQFVEWLQRTGAIVPIVNDVETVLWNRDKFYLRELEAQGIEIAPTIFVADGQEIGSTEWSQIQGWSKVVVKPAVSASAHNTWLGDSTEFPTQAELTHRMQGEAFLVQQFIPEIQTQGEISFTLIDGAYSHAVQKRPAAGDFRVQEEHGGSSELFVPSSSLLGQVDAIAGAVPQVRKSLYCRIDVVERAGKLVLMELELIEPELYLNLAEGAAERLAKAIIKRIP